MQNVAIPETQYKELVLRRLRFGSSPAEHCVVSAVQGLTLQSLSVLCSVVPKWGFRKRMCVFIRLCVCVLHSLQCLWSLGLWVCVCVCVNMFSTLLIKTHNVLNVNISSIKWVPLYKNMAFPAPSWFYGKTCCAAHSLTNLNESLYSFAFKLHEHVCCGYREKSIFNTW